MPDYSEQIFSENDAANTAPAPRGLQTASPPSHIVSTTHALMGAGQRSYNRANNTATSTGTAAAYQIEFDQPIANYARGEVYKFIAHIANTAGATLRIGGLPALPMVFNEDGLPITAGTIAAGCSVEGFYDGTNFRVASLDRYSPRITATEAAVTALTANSLNIGVTNIRSAAKGAVSTGTVTFNYADGPVQSIEIAGTVAFALSNLPAIGGPLQINITYTSGTIGMPSGVQWELGGTAKGTLFSQVDASFVAGARYRLIFEMVNGVLTGSIL